MKSKEVNNIEPSKYANTFAFHDFVIKDIEICVFFEYIVSLFREYNIEPTQMGITSPLNNSKKMNTFTREKKKLEKIPADQITAISLEARSFSKDNNLHGNRIFTFNFIREKIGYCVVVFDSHFFSFEPLKTKDICNNIISFLSPNYAYMFKREFKKGPEYYPFGVISGLPFFNCPERELINNWNNHLVNNTYKTGDLRDIYPINMITDVHLNRHVTPTVTLREFIEQSADNGRLEPLNDTHYLWYVAEDQIENVREKIRPSGIAIAI